MTGFNMLAESPETDYQQARTGAKQAGAYEKF
jgi:hypothetical protein